MKNQNPEQYKPEAFARMKQAMSVLTIPDLDQLRQVLSSQVEGVRAEISRLRRQQDQVRADGMAAATRLMMPEGKTLQDFHKSYHDQILQLRGDL